MGQRLAESRPGAGEISSTATTGRCLLLHIAPILQPNPDLGGNAVAFRPTACLIPAQGTRPGFLALDFPVQANGLLHSFEADALDVEEGGVVPSALEIVVGAMNRNRRCQGTTLWTSLVVGDSSQVHS